MTRVRLHLLRSGSSKAPPGWFVARGGLRGALGGLGIVPGTMLESPVVSFAIEHPTAGTVLVDTGLHPSVADDRVANFGRLNAMVFRGLRMDPAGGVREQLAARAIDADAIETVLMTHLHVDHASGLSQFPGTRVLVDRTEWEAAHRQGARSGYHLPQLVDDVTYELLDMAGEGFDHAFDLFGDGSVDVVSTPGHTLGHLSLVVRTAERDVLLCGDAIYTLENLEEGREPLKTEDRGAYRRSVAQLRAFIAAHRDAVVVPGHDAAAWDALAPAY